MMPFENESKEASSEKDKVKRLLPRFEEALRVLKTSDFDVEVLPSFKLPYANEILSYKADSVEPFLPNAPPYETDLLIRDVYNSNKNWVPRVVIEFKFGQVTTHDALTYSAKASTHKHVHPYLRYGTVIADYGSSIPPRLIRHGAYFDFIVVWEEAEPSNVEWEDLTDILMLEVRASRILQEVLSGKVKHHRLHRPLKF
jgi:hypothetical protein